MAAPGLRNLLIVTDDGAVLRLPPGEGGPTSHGARIDALVTRLGNHPMHAGLPRQWRAADIEVYRYTRGPAEQVQVLSYAREPATGLNFPIEWTVRYGKGRVYTSTLGHVWPGDPALKACSAPDFRPCFSAPWTGWPESRWMGLFRRTSRPRTRHP
ncbi:MAG: ThuA domain-containing protein [Collinsella sp.]